ncbi:MAG: MarR family winged helix-turn-helix transcriptional regulator [Chitinophagaceae bacterium]|nr:MarR family winged helix-turn-helix transcriptional regulator [Chitinophagaceae bacterium]
MRAKSFIPVNQNASVIFHVIKLSETWKKYGECLTREYGITVQQWFILLLLANDPNIIYLQKHPQKKPLMAMELADALNVSRANVTNLLNLLLKKKLIFQVNDNLDKRRKRLKLTPLGKKLLKKLEKKRHAYNAILLNRFSEKQKQQIIRFLSQCIDFIEEDLKNRY